MNRNILLVLAAAVFAAGCETSSCDQSPTAPSGGVSPSVQPPEISVPANSDLRENDAVTVTLFSDAGTGSIAVAFVLVRDDGATMKVVCGSEQSVGTRTASVALQGDRYLWAKGHTINGVVLEAHFKDRNEAFRFNGCYFLDPNQDPFTVHLERATKRTDILLNWRVE